MVLHLIQDDIYIEITITSWAQGKVGGFTYTRSTPKHEKSAFVAFIILVRAATGAAMESSFESAQTKAAAENKKVLLVFSGSDWCIPCIRLEDKVWKSREFIRYAESGLHLYRADFPKRKKKSTSSR